MTEIIKNSIHYISTKFPSVFLKYLRNQLKASELKNSSLYEITKVAHDAITLDELYKSIHDLGIADNTVVFLVSDNGPWLPAGSAWPLKGSKYNTFEYEI